jgi:hypothetical protein
MYGAIWNTYCAEIFNFNGFERLTAAADCRGQEMLVGVIFRVAALQVSIAFWISPPCATCITMVQMWPSGAASIWLQAGRVISPPCARLRRDAGT